ncbi:MAG: hypothetical protein ACM3KL_01580 [Alphaproteobacteria bacterium]
MKNSFRRFTPNLETRGRVLRGATATVMAVAAAVSWPKSVILATGFALASGFLAFEATRGWCALRACGVKTKF